MEHHPTKTTNDFVSDDPRCIRFLGCRWLRSYQTRKKTLLMVGMHLVLRLECHNDDHYFYWRSLCRPPSDRTCQWILHDLLSAVYPGE